MKRDDILVMEPGRELDAQIADKVMGCEIKNNFFIGAERHLAYNTPDGRLIRCHRWTPSTDIAAAWEVVERMKMLNWWFVLNSEVESWTALFYWDPHQESFEARCTSAPESICKAALLACIGGDNE